MRKNILFGLVFLFVGLNTNAQEIILGKNKQDTSYYNKIDKKLTEFKLTDIRKSNYDILRISSRNHIYEITKDSIIYIPYLTTEEDRNKPVFGPRFILKNTINFDEIKDVINLKDIHQMSVMIDGKTYEVEGKVDNNYYYYNTILRDSSADSIFNLIRKINQSIHQEQLLNSFYKSLPSNYYYGIAGNLEILPYALNRLIASEEKKSKHYLAVEKILKDKFGRDEYSASFFDPKIILKTNDKNFFLETQVGVLLSKLNSIPEEKVKNVYYKDDHTIIVELKK